MEVCHCLLRHNSFLLPYRPVLLRHCGLRQIEHVDIGHKRRGFVHRIELNGVVQEEEIRLVARVAFHLADHRLLLRPIRGA